MGVDDYLLDSADTPVLRLYAWQVPTLSLGYAQKPDWIDWQAVKRHGARAVRRPTGGRALLHDAELTYAIVLPQVGGLSVAHCYEALTAWLGRGLRRLGIPVSSSPAMPSSNSPRHPGCYYLQQRGELTLAGSKLVGSAQARRGDRLLQHGAIPLQVDPVRLGELIPQHKPYLGLEQRGDYRLDRDGLARALVEAWGGEATETPLSPEEQRQAARRAHSLALQGNH